MSRSLPLVIHDPDQPWHTYWVTEAKYSGPHGALVRRSYNNEAEYRRAFHMLSTKASTDWVRGYRLNVTVQWTAEQEVDRRA